MQIELFTDADGNPRFRIVSKANGKVIASSEAYATKASRTRTVKQLVKYTGLEIAE